MPKFHSFRILLMASEPVLADLVSFRLELLGYDIFVVGSGGEASDRLHRHRYDLVICDTTLTDGDGLDWLTKTRLVTDADSLPVMILSLDPSLDTVCRAYLAGAQDYLITPFDPTVLEQKVEHLLKGASLLTN